MHDYLVYGCVLVTIYMTFVRYVNIDLYLHNVILINILDQVYVVGLAVNLSVKQDFITPIE